MTREKKGLGVIASQCTNRRLGSTRKAVVLSILHLPFVGLSFSCPQLSICDLFGSSFKYLERSDHTTHRLLLEEYRLLSSILATSITTVTFLERIK